ncbi:MAG: A/G-specific adenine glycosylase [Mucilaginibacter polytrichastri]|nr:A/G-specific adenine glycosylase [Mucilaginibacter polytrichastri]
MNDPARAEFSVKILNWYLKNKRDLPWRHTHDPYVIWLSEIILQQTRVEQGMPYFYRFLERFPDVQAFASASEDEVLALWQGLGYYSRGRNMLRTARQVVEELDGIFPVKYDQLLKLKGIGEYTAAAISSFAADEPHAVVDGNVYRVFARYFGVEEASSSLKGKREVAGLAYEMLNRHHPGEHNQAMIEFGALLCKPRNPDCGLCPVRAGCYALEHGKVAVLPAKKKKKALRDRYFHVFLLECDGRLFIMRRDAADIWANLYQPLIVETQQHTDFADVLSLPEIAALGLSSGQWRPASPAIIHLLSHQRLHMVFHHCVLSARPAALPESFVPGAVSSLANFAMPQPVFNKIKIIFNL